MNRWKKPLALLLCLALCAGAGWGIARLVELLTTTEGSYTFRVLADGTAEIRQYRGGGGPVEIPATLRDHPVSGIGGKAFNWRFYITRLTLPGSVTRIAEGAFAGCHGMEAVDLPGSLAEIGAKAFSGCRKLKSVALPRSLERIGDEAFERCLALTEIALPAGVAEVGANPFAGCKNLARIDVAEGHPALEVSEGALLNRADGRLICCPYPLAQGEWRVPEGVRVIGAAAFSDCDRLTGIRLPAGVTDLREHAFYGCSALKSADLPEGARSIGGAAFAGCSALGRVTLPEGVEEIGYLAFYNCAGLRELVLPESVRDIGNGAFIGCRNLTLVVAPGSWAEAYCRSNDLPYRLAEPAE